MENVFEDRALQQYLKEISTYKSLNKDEERIWALRAKEGDQDAIDMLIRSNLKFVVKIAARYQGRGLSLSELISEGNIGLIKALEKFDPDKDIKLISYAIWWIKQKIMQAVAEKSSMIRVPLGKINSFNKIKSTREKAFNRTGEDLSLSEIEAITHINKNSIETISRQVTPTLSLDEASMSDNDQDVFMSNYISDDAEYEPQAVFESERLQKNIDRAIKKLDRRESYILKAYFGLDDTESRNFASIADEMHLSRERVRQIQKEALKKILKEITPDRDSEISLLFV
ncbi:MAG: RNA polymerase sigma factor RpoD/SigA [Candidatus Cloacimonetes bacterium]|nr:RNA polymerase sigma factor RpoD/SigA [Candidatus Cloacimonadota bacterium]